MLPQIKAYVKGYDDGAKRMSFLTDDKLFLIYF